jgi:ADP-heptose:LPS heptosyltransferase
MTDDFVLKAKAMENELIINMRDSVKRLRDLISIIANCDLLIAASTGPLHIASALGIKTIGLYCHRPMNCSRHWGALGKNAANLEINKEYCDANCSSDKEVCSFENGISVEEVISMIKRD